MPTAVRVASDIPRLDADQGGRRCDGSSPDHTLDHAQRGQVSNGHAGNGGSGRMGNGGCGNTSRERTGNGNGCGHTGNGRGCGNTSRERMGNGAGRSWGLHDHPLAMVYSPYQHFRDTYTPDIALGRGTLFSELDLPFEGYHNKRNGGCAR